MNPLAVERLSVAFQGAEILSRIDLKVEAGDYIGIVGPNGSGKTTLMRAMLGLVPASSGRVVLFGRDQPSFTDWKRIGYLPQRLAHLDQRFPANVEEVVAAGLIASRSYPKEMNSADRDRVMEILHALEIAELRTRMIGRLSGGQQQRVLLARALVHGPELLFLDEPTTALDPGTREIFYALLQKINQTRRTAILFVSHDPVAIGKHAGKLLYLDKRVVFFGTFDDFCHSSDMTRYFGEGQHLICHRHG